MNKIFFYDGCWNKAYARIFASPPTKLEDVTLAHSNTLVNNNDHVLDKNNVVENLALYVLEKALVNESKKFNAAVWKKISKILFVNGIKLYISKLGEGYNGEVFKLDGSGFHKGKELALKVGRIKGDLISLNLDPKQGFSRPYALLIREGENIILKKNVSYAEVSKKADSTSYVVGILSQAIDGQTFDEWIEKNKDDGTPIQNLKDCIDIIQQLQRRIESLAAKKIVHGDLSRKNILLKKPHKVKIIDFGNGYYAGTPRSDWFALKEIIDYIIVKYFPNSYETLIRCTEDMAEIDEKIWNSVNEDGKQLLKLRQKVFYKYTPNIRRKETSLGFYVSNEVQGELMYSYWQRLSPFGT